ncbi:putative damage-inducible protein DinB [Actinokineospora baliensis]|uniref:DinB family protein n=1 Tax=Actinokineospora baliensis TaxID=547056 RepID=UPI00195E9080|nr:DinB family protein [Actinokineospora baliensis]MBM7770066.1 putative damage-inducible protein DinB [Actinokineospora baliensis]
MSSPLDLSTTPTATDLDTERADLLQTLTVHRGFLRHTAQGLTDEQAAQRTTVSALTIGGLIKHVASTEAAWYRFMVGGAAGMASVELDWEDEHRMNPGESLETYLANYAEVAAKTDELVRTADLNQAFPLPEAPWFEAGATRSVRRVLLHIIAETAQHAGHADIIRESLDGQKTMG